MSIEDSSSEYNNDEEMSSNPEPITEPITDFVTDSVNSDRLCHICNTIYCSKGNVKRHLKNVHNITMDNQLLPSFPISALDDHEVETIDSLWYNCSSDQELQDGDDYADSKLDPNAPDFHCRSCNHTYSNVNTFREHLAETHSITLEPPSSSEHDSDPIIKPNSREPDLYCHDCDRTYAHESSLQRHRAKAHRDKQQINRQIYSIIHPELEPDPNDPNFYCRACEHTYSSCSNFMIHISKFHQIELPKLLNSTPRRDIEPDPDDPNNYCRSCDHTYVDHRGYITHLRKIHNIIVEIEKPAPPENPNCPIKYPELEPDPKDPNYYCRTCDHTYSNKYNFRNHLSRIHNILIKLEKATPLESPNCPIKYPELEPDPKDPNYYCRTCDHTYSSKSCFKIHLFKFHGVPIEPAKLNGCSNCIVHPELEPDPNDPNLFCRSCEHTYSRLRNFKDHLFKIHNIVVEKPPRPLKVKSHIKHPDLEPDPNDPNNYCSFCNRKYTRKYSFKRHLATAHNIESQSTTASPKSLMEYPEIEPDSEDPNLYCRICDCTFVSKAFFKNHLVKVHKMLFLSTSVTSKRFIKHPEREPNPYDPNFYCHSCDRGYPNKYKFKDHLSKYHESIVAPPQISSRCNDKNPNYYCHYCEQEFKNEFKYNVHLSRVHGLTNKQKFQNPPIFRPDVVPDMNDPHNYCRSCRYSYDSLYDFRLHLRSVHDMQVELTEEASSAGELPLTNDASLYCKICKFTYVYEDAYKRHLIKYHPSPSTNYHGSESSTPEDNQSSETENDVEIENYIMHNNRLMPYCKICKITFTSNITHKRHCRRIHGITEYTSPRQQPKPKPNTDIVSDPNNYCRSCDYTFRRLDGYKQHLKRVHGINWVRPPFRPTNPQPDVNDPSNYCQACNTLYMDRSGYRLHLRTSHHLKPAPFVDPLKSDLYLSCDACDKTFPDNASFDGHFYNIHCLKPVVRPDLDDPNFFCDSCEVKFSSFLIYRRHLRLLHNIETDLRGKRVRSSRALQPDTNNADNYCTACCRTYKDRRRFINHLYYYHGMTVSECVNTPSSSDTDLRRLSDCPSPTLQPDTNNYCNVCCQTFKDRRRFRSHLYQFHKIAISECAQSSQKPSSSSSSSGGGGSGSDEENKNENVAIRSTTTSNTTSYYCDTCQMSFITKYIYQDHLRMRHVLRSTEDEMNPFLCGICKDAFKTIHACWRHQKEVHLQLSTSNSSEHRRTYDKKDESGSESDTEDSEHDEASVTRRKKRKAKSMEDDEPDVYDPNNHCRACRTTYSRRSNYLNHLNKKHKVWVVDVCS
ncbi:MAG: hypothetical protein EXX96DRAFT_329111 [Benjaminiella poitrasii]|nr:MAG: hypothetical protein EXX96DRAFT_329111 [Benjaminiella poitrasii]